MSALFSHAVICFIVMVLFHFVLSRFTGSRFFVLKSLLVLAVSLVLLLISDIFVGFMQFLVFATILISLWNSYIIFFVNLQNSISFRILHDISKLSLGSMSLDDLNRLYSDDVSFNDRISAMQRNKFVSRNRNLIVLTSKGELYAKSFKLFRKIFGIDVFG